MRKQDFMVVVVLLALMMLWPVIYNHFFPSAPAPAPADVQYEEPAVPAMPEEPVIRPADRTDEPSAIAPRTAPVQEQPYQSETPRRPEKRQIVKNEEMVLTFSSHGAGILTAELQNYRQSVEHDSGPVMIDFADSPALIFPGLPEMSKDDDFDMLYDMNRPQEISFEKRTAEGWLFTRTISLRENYQVDITDNFSNPGDIPLVLPEYEVQLGEMSGITDDFREAEFLGVDVLESVGGEGVIYWGKKIPKIFRTEAQLRGYPVLPESISQYMPNPVDWVAAKNKFFTQIIVPAQANPAIAYRMSARRRLVPGEQQNPALSPKKAEVVAVASALVFPEVTVRPGDAVERQMRYYAGPKKFSILREIGMKQEEVMEFGMWSPVCKLLLTLLNFAYSIIPSYGVAIILLTMLIRILFWPLTHKSTESMKKMQTLQPEMTAIRAKFKDNPKKMQAEIMDLYRKNKVNPMGGCLPMIVQIPVFIALFVVLRSAIELRFAEFLWIKDLSEPERLLAGYLPIPLNILPIFMAVTMVWQQKLMPTPDGNQQRIMMIFMPIMMLVMFYMMPSALVLYWSTNQCIMIAQQLIHKKLGFGPLTRLRRVIFKR